MKEFLFSRSHKKHYSSAVVRMGKNNLGFSIVELIIVIAIMAVLAAIAIPVFGMYIEKTKIANDKQKATDVLYAVNLAGQSMQYPTDVVQATTDGSGLQVPVGFIVLTNGKDKDGNDTAEVVFIGSDDNVVRDSNGNVTAYNPGSGSNAAIMEQILADILGEDYAKALQYDGWSTTTSIPQLYGDSNELYGEMKDLCEDFIALQGMAGLAELIGYDIKSKFNAEKQDGYDNSVDVVATLSKTFIARFPTEEEFVQAWNGYLLNANKTAYEDKFYTTYAFGLSGTGMGMEAYTAVRRAYNEALANYVRDHSTGEFADHTTTGYEFASWTGLNALREGSKSATLKTESTNNVSTHVQSIIECGDKVVSVVVSDTVNQYMFDKDSTGAKKYSHTKQNILDSNYDYYLEGSLDDDVQMCADCKALVEAYRNTDIAKNDASAFYKLMTSMYKTSDEALAEAEGKSGDAQWGYYDNLVQSFANSYESVAAYTENLESCIVITVFADANGVLYAECNTPGVLDE